MAREPLRASIAPMLRTGLVLLVLGVLLLLAYGFGMVCGLVVWLFNLPMRIVRGCRGSRA